MQKPNTHSILLLHAFNCTLLLPQLPHKPCLSDLSHCLCLPKMPLDISVVFVKHLWSSVFLQCNGCVKTSNSTIKKCCIFLPRFAALASWVHTSVYSLYSFLVNFYKANDVVLLFYLAILETREEVTVDITFQSIINCVTTSDKPYNVTILLKLDFPDRDSSSHRYL